MQNFGKQLLQERKAKQNRREFLYAVILGLALGASVITGHALYTLAI